MKYPSSIIWLQRILGKSTGQIFVHRTQCSYYPDNEHGLDAQAVAALVFAKILENMLLVTGEKALLFNCADVYCRRVQHTKSCILLTITHNIPNYDRNSIIYLRTLAAIHVQAHEWPSNTTGHYLLICRKCSRGVRWQNSIKFIFKKTQTAVWDNGAQATLAEETPEPASVFGSAALNKESMTLADRLSSYLTKANENVCILIIFLIYENTLI